MIPGPWGGTTPLRPAIVFSLVYCPVDNTLFEVRAEIRFSSGSGHYCCYGSKPI